MNLSARDLRAVIAVVEERNFTRAAERVHLSQPAFSALISGIEDGLGARLFERNTRNVTLTPEGELFAASARRVLGDFDGMISNFRDHAQRRRGRVAIAALPSLAAGWVPGVLAEYHASYPGIEIALIDSLSEQCLAHVRSGQADFALAAAGDKDADLASEALCQDEFHLVCRADHPLATQEPIRLRDLAKFPFVHLSRNSSVRQHLEAAFHPVSMQTIVEVEHLATVTGLVCAGLGITVVPALTLFHFERPELVVRPLALKGLRRQILLVRRKNEALSVAAQTLHDLMLSRRPTVSARGGGAGRSGPRAKTR